MEGNGGEGCTLSPSACVRAACTLALAHAMCSTSARNENILSRVIVPHPRRPLKLPVLARSRISLFHERKPKFSAAGTMNKRRSYVFHDQKYWTIPHWSFITHRNVKLLKKSPVRLNSFNRISLSELSCPFTDLSVSWCVQWHEVGSD